jgi:hypothetical protein
MKTFFTLRDYQARKLVHVSYRSLWLLARALERTKNKENSLGVTFGHWRDIFAELPELLIQALIYKYCSVLCPHACMPIIDIQAERNAKVIL